MTLAHELYLDQQHCEQQGEISEDLYLSGLSDGYNNLSKTSGETEYLLGYIAGLLQIAALRQEENEKLLAVLKNTLKRSATSEDIPF